MRKQRVLNSIYILANFCSYFFNLKKKSTESLKFNLKYHEDNKKKTRLHNEVSIRRRTLCMKPFFSIKCHKIFGKTHGSPK